jgi:peptidylprolyl isomerase
MQSSDNAVATLTVPRDMRQVSPRRVRHGDRVKVHYRGSLKNGTIFSSTSGSEPMQFTLGGDQVLPGFEAAVLGMRKGEVRQIVIPAEKAYGNRDQDLTVTVKRSRLPDGIEPSLGRVLLLHTKLGKSGRVRIIGISEDHITLDANHPLAGEDLRFTIKLIDICSRH